MNAMKTNLINTIMKIRNPERFRHYKFLKKCEYDTIKNNRIKQQNLLYDLLNYSINNIPFYINFAQKNNIKLNKKTIFQDVKKFPILTRTLLNSNFEQFRHTSKHKKFKINHSGGSTGEPVRFLQDPVYVDQAMATKLLYYDWAGKKNGGKLLRLWGSERDILRQTRGFNGWVNRNIQNTLLLNSFIMDKTIMDKYCQIINFEKPSVIEAYAQSIYELSKFIEKRKIAIYSPNGIIASASTLSPEMKKQIERVFHCTVLNRYGSREVGDVACSCSFNEGLHLNILNHYVEILNDKVLPCNHGETGHIYITTLNNFIMPLIRYDIGDLGILNKNELCSCNRGYPLIAAVIGRDIESFRTKDGKIIPGEFFIHFLGVVYNTGHIKKFQVIQNGYQKITIYHVLNKEDIDSKLKMIETKKKMNLHIKQIFGKNCLIFWKEINELKPTKSGKFQYTFRAFKLDYE